MEPDVIKSLRPDLHKPPHQDTEIVWEAFPCQHCERHFNSKPGLERHMHVHALANSEEHVHISNNSNMASGTTQGELQPKNMKPLDSVMQHHTSSPAGSHTSLLKAGDHIAQPDEQGVHLQLAGEEKPQLPVEENLERIFGETAEQITQLSENIASATVLQNAGQQAQYMLDVSSNISENLSFYIDGKIVSTSTVSSCEAAEAHSGSSALVGLDALILDPAQISQVLNTDSVTEIPGLPLAKRRTATPPLLPQIKTELESEVVVSSSSSSLVSSLIENLLPLNTESTVLQKERTVFLSPKLKQLLEKQEGLNPTLALITEGQKPISLSVLPIGTGRFKRRTGSPTNSTSIEETPVSDTGNIVAEGTGQMETQQISPMPLTATEKDDATPPVEEPAVKPVSTESWPPMTGGNSCNQQPLDLSNTVKRNDDLALADAALDLSLQRRLGECGLTINLVSQAVLTEETLNSCMMAKPFMNMGEQNISLGSLENSLLTDFAIVTGSEIMTSVEPMAEGLVYGLALPPGSLTPSPALQPASPCTIAFASPSSHSMLTSTPSLITVLASSPHITNPSNQPIQMLAPNISPDPLVICTENALNRTECDLTAAFAGTNPANLVTLSRPLDPTLNLQGHVFLTDQIALNPSLVESTALSEVPFTPTVTLSDSFLNSYNISSNTVLIECTISLETPGSVVPAAITLQESPSEAPVPTQMVVDHIEQQQIVSDAPTVDPTILLSSIAESVTLATTTSAVSDCPPVAESSPNTELVVGAEPSTTKEEEAADDSLSSPETPSQTSPLTEKEEEDNSSFEVPGDAQQQTFTKNFICNVCDKLFHSMKELSQHVGDHADEWPYKCEFCVLLFGKPSALLDHRSSLHGVGKTYVCSACTKEFVYLCNLKRHQEELHPGQQCTFTEEEKGKLRPQNCNNSTKVSLEPSVTHTSEEAETLVKKEESEVDVAAEELFTTIKIMASDGGKIKGPDVRLGINQHYPSFKPPPFPYHNRSPAGLVASATNFTTHNIPQTFTTAIRCTKCGKSFDNMPELHKHILACANASDKRRYTPKKNPIPLRHFAKTQNGVLSTTNSTNGLNASNRASQSNRSKPHQESPIKMKFKLLNKRKKKFVQRVMPQRNKSVSSSNKASSAQVDVQVFVCPHCNREFSMRRSRTKHMAVCPKKPKEVKKRKEGGISLTKENNDRLHRGISRDEQKQQASPQHKTRFQTSSLAKRPAILPVQTVFSNKRSKIIIKESMQPKQESPTLNELPIVRTFNPSMRQYSRVQHGVKGIPIKITIVKPQQTAPQRDELLPAQSREEATGGVTSSSEQSVKS
ncbi:PR domain zinc finger protein 2 [Pleuronectes platessa]|uniref:PR domain zinc finger protein 2 n=1 Tax=Pleuronectes platessa TaxID=8262 RepID=UPI00232A1147|nr:PR domain zinc finger protein 2 [Pleuronectes platessa]